MGLQCSTCCVAQTGVDEVAIVFDDTKTERLPPAVKKLVDPFQPEPQCSVDRSEDLSNVAPNALEDTSSAAVRQPSDWISSSSTAASSNSMSDFASAQATESSHDLSHSTRDSFSSTGAQSLTSRSEPASSLEEALIPPETDTDARTIEPPNLRGTWVMTGIDGDYGLFMADTGESQPSPRHETNGVDYGMGTRVQEISQDDNYMTIANVTALGPHLITSDYPMSFCIGGGPTKTMGLDGARIMVTADMAGDVLVMRCRRKSKHAAGSLQTFRRYLEGNKMVVEVEIGEDKTARRVFVQRSK